MRVVIDDERSHFSALGVAVTTEADESVEIVSNHSILPEPWPSLDDVYPLENAEVSERLHGEQQA